MYEALPKNEKTFEIDVVGVDTGVQYQGTFTVRCILSMADRHAMEMEKTRLMADFAHPSGGLAGIATTLASLRVKIIKGPPWWENSDGGTTIMDENAILAIYDACNKAEMDWRSALRKQAEEAAASKEKPKPVTAPTNE